MSEALYLQANNLAVGFGSTPVVEDVAFRCEPGTITAIVGTNGAGKTTVLRALAGIHPMLAGQVTLGQAQHGAVGGGDDAEASQPPRWDVATMGVKQRAKKIAMVSQEGQLAEDLTVREIVTLGRLPHTTPWEFSAKKHQGVVDKAIATCELEAHADTPCGALSGGMRKRAMIARGFAQETPVLILDEPTNHLDIYHQLNLLELLAASGKTVVITLHDLDLAIGYADQVVVLEKQGNLGRQVLCDAPVTALQDPLLHQTFGVRGYVAQANDARLDAPLQRAHLLLEKPRKEDHETY
ncbi:ABC transporter ATP-binding protein [Corynebacterium pseudopelargi]|uniref:Putative siderophore transport system ATP-binding protein YusV n=1 Tax=Corynebacterium pseudopelargi TaxID=2080757 RepID=A0A3G6IUL2_9CORY|nr:ABC transporter ATP-binding protein [Corynebacterium pseudopelargi]AZA09439.1 putative siderophore transport system ATP-binding protein YusV [Corynebacterium pseudopelargi]